MGFVQHKPETKHSIHLVPRVVITERAAAIMGHLVAMCPLEIGWLGSVTRTPNPPQKQMIFQVNNIYLMDQAVHGTETEASEVGSADVVEDIFQLFPDADEATREVNAIRLWGHSHVRMGVSPSATDDKTMDYFQETTQGGDNRFFLRLIANKNGEMKIDTYEWDRGIITIDAPWSILSHVDETLRAELEEEYRAKVRRATWGGGKTSYRAKDDAAGRWNDDNYSYNNANYNYNRAGFNTSAHKSTSAALYKWWTCTNSVIEAVRTRRMDEIDRLVTPIGLTSPIEIKVKGETFMKYSKNAVVIILDQLSLLEFMSAILLIPASALITADAKLTTLYEVIQQVEDEKPLPETDTTADSTSAKQPPENTTPKKEEKSSKAIAKTNQDTIPAE